MRLTRFRVAGMIAILGCGAAWTASSRAQTGTAGRSSAAPKPRGQQADPFQLKTAISTHMAGVVQVSSPAGLSGQEKAPGKDEASQLPSIQFRELSAPTSVTRPSPGHKKQVVDLRDRIASNPHGTLGQTVSDDQQPRRSLEWVDATIPQQLFDQAQMAPRQPSSAEETQAAPAPATLTLGNHDNEAARTAPRTERVLILRELAPPEVSPTELSSEKKLTIERTTNDEPEAQSLQLPKTAPVQQPTASLSTDEQSDQTSSASELTNATNTAAIVPKVVGSDDNLSSPEQNPSPIGSQKSNEGRVPGETFTPSQAIPQWIDRDARQDEIPQDTSRPMPLSQTQQQLAIPVPSGISDSAPGNWPAQSTPPAYQPAPGTTPAPINSQGLLTKPNSAPVQPEPNQDKAKTDHTPRFSIAQSYPPESDALSGQVGYCPNDFSDCSGPTGSTFDPYAAAHVYRGKFAITTQRPLVELWRPLYTGGVYAPAPTWFGVTNPMKPHFLVYGDMRTAVGVNQNSQGKSNVWGNVLNLDMDLQLTSTERVHAFVSPLNRGTTASGVSFNDELDLIDGTNLNFNTLFFEGDVGALLGGARGTYPPFDLPFTFGLIPLIYQNGIWANDAVLGAAVALPARHSRALGWSNFDATLFWATDNVTTDAFPNQDSAADFFGTAWFIDAYEGYIEADYAFVNDNTGSNRGYHNISMAFTRRYLSKLSNSVRLIVNTGQKDLAPINRTADGHLLLIENSFISAYPNTIVPYVNLFYGQGRPQSLARVGIAGGILTNTGINFETDGITGYPTLDPTGSNVFGFASGINMLGSQFAHQLILEFAMLQAVGSRELRNAAGDEYGVGVRYQKPLSHNLIFRTDHMAGFREDATNITGSRIELRWKF